jgi:tetratricopeptide (TPR) repeat protein
MKLRHYSVAALRAIIVCMDPRRPATAERPRCRCVVICLLAVSSLASLQSAAWEIRGPRGSTSHSKTTQPAATASQLREQALDLAYNLDHEQAIALLRRAVALAPDDPSPHRSLANVIWLNLLFRRGAVTVDHYLGSFARADVDLAKPPPELDAEFRTHIQRSIALAERQLVLNPKDVQAHYDLGAALGIQGSYVATVEGRMLAGFKSARRSYDEHERVLALDPSRTDAGLVVGTYRYVVSTLSVPVRLMAYVAGFGGGRERGIQMLQATAARETSPGGIDARTDALFALVLVYNRERRYDDAMRVLQDLRRRYPRNRLLLLEAGATALRGGRAQQAEDLLSEGLAMMAADRRPRIPGEEALWRYKRGAARAALGRADALSDLQRGTEPDAALWVGGRARVEMGRLALKRGDRAAAGALAHEAEALCQRGNDPICVEDARGVSRSSNGR